MRDFRVVDNLWTWIFRNSETSRALFRTWMVCFIVAPIEMATGARAYYVGKPNPVMMRIALQRVACRREDTIIIGDRMDTDIVAGIEAGIETVLVLTGVTTENGINQFAYRPSLMLTSIAEIPG